MNILKLIVNRNDAITALDKNIRIAQGDYQEKLGAWIAEMNEHIAKLNEYLLAPDYEEEQPNGRVDKPLPIAKLRPLFPTRLYRLRDKLTKHALDTVEITEVEYTTIFTPYEENYTYGTLSVGGGTISSGTISAGNLQL